MSYGDYTNRTTTGTPQTPNAPGAQHAQKSGGSSKTADGDDSTDLGDDDLIKAGDNLKAGMNQSRRNQEAMAAMPVGTISNAGGPGVGGAMSSFSLGSFSGGNKFTGRV
jgi:hypothetical protein